MFKHNTNKNNIENSLEKHILYWYQIFSLNINILTMVGDNLIEKLILEIIKHKLYKTERSFIVKDKSIIFLSWNDYFIKNYKSKSIQILLGYCYSILKYLLLCKIIGINYVIFQIYFSCPSWIFSHFFMVKKFACPCSTSYYAFDFSILEHSILSTFKDE